MHVFYYWRIDLDKCQKLYHTPCYLQFGNITTCRLLDTVSEGYKDARVIRWEI